jgi:hypothetical protein
LSKQAQRKKLGKKEMPLLRALPEPARFFEKKRGKKTKLGRGETSFSKEVSPHLFSKLPKQKNPEICGLFLTICTKYDTMRTVLFITNGEPL